ncbi:MAG: lysophospholipid acyltransferase family protein [Spirochaetales bacterium]
MKVRERIVNATIKTLFRLLFRLDAHQLQHVPKQGPGILLSNHVTNLEGPLFYVFLRPRKATALGKIELWQNPVTRFFMNTWDIIPLHRGSVDAEAMRRTFRALDQGYFVGIAAEGTRSKTGELQRGRPGATLVATRADVPVVPIAQWGLHNMGGYLKRFRRPPATVRVGRPFYLRKPGGGTIGRSERAQMVDEMMYQLAVLLPPAYRGAYADLDRMTTEYISYV